MILQLDVGNTRVKWRVVDGVEVRFRGAGALGAADLFDAIPIDSRLAIQGVHVASVGGAAAKAVLTSRLTSEFGCAVRFVQVQSSVAGLRIAYDNPASLGVDRWLAMLAVWKKYRSSFVVVDAGSALTIDYVDGQGGHLGGYILPGWQMLERSLLQGTAQVRFDVSEATQLDPGTSTGDCVSHGRNWLWRAMVERLGLEFQAGKIERMVVTGGDAGRLIALGLQAEHWPDVVLDALSD